MIEGVIGKCDIAKHRINSEPQCLRCFLPSGAKNLDIRGITYLYEMPNGEVRACQQGKYGWFEVAPPKED